jgi:chromosomal replication initiator protein
VPALSSPTRPTRTTSADAKRISQKLAKSIGPQKYDAWFSHTRVSVEGQRVELATDSQFAANWIGSHFAAALRDAARATLGQEASVDVCVAPDLFGRRDVEDRTSNDTPAAPPPTHGRRRGKPRRNANLRRLSRFIVGDSNRLAYAAASRLGDSPDEDTISPLFIHGGCGLGKTHLLQGICRRFTDTTGRPRAVRYVTGEQFTNEFIAAVRHSTVEEFRQRTRRLELLAIDDVHFLSNKVRTQSEFLHTLDALGHNGARVVLASDEHPRQIKRFSQALISRFLSGMVVRVDPPDRETRVSLAKRLATGRGLSINSAALDIIADRCLGSVRELEGAITKLAAVREVAAGQPTNDEVGVALASQVFKDGSWRPPVPIRLPRIIEIVCERLGVTGSDLVGNGRHRRIVLARALVAHLGRELTTHSYPEIARAMGRTYHSTVHSAAQRLQRQINAEEHVAIDDGREMVALRDLSEQLRHEIVRTAGSVR